MNSTGSARFQWLAGYFYSDFYSQAYDAFIMPGALPLFGTSNIYTAPYAEKIIQESIFGEVSYQLTSELKATVGLRRYSYTSPITLSYSGYEATGSNAVDTFSSDARDHRRKSKI